MRLGPHSTGAVADHQSSGDILYDNHLRPPPASSGETKGPTVRSAS